MMGAHSWASAPSYAPCGLGLTVNTFNKRGANALGYSKIEKKTGDWLGKGREKMEDKTNILEMCMLQSIKVA